MVHASRTFRVFLSSTFNDLIDERNALHEHVFPALQALCRAHDVGFQAIDLRWGVSDEAAFGQQTVRICIEEIRRCQQTGLHPNFLIVLGDRYGWRPLPDEIAADRFGEILGGLAAEPVLLHRLKRWYRRDENAQPPVLCLRPRTGQWRDSERWQDCEQAILRAFECAAQMLGRATEVEPYGNSATEQEIQRGALQVADARCHVHCFARTIEGLPLDESGSRYFDWTRAGGPDAEAQSRLADLKQRLAGHLGTRNYHSYSVRWAGTGISSDHLAADGEASICRKVRRALEDVIRAELESLHAEDPLEREISAHENFARARRACFAGRADAIDRILRYLAAPEGRPLVIWGEPGSGKSALMAAAIERGRAEFAPGQVICRFIGATPESSNGRGLLESLCQEVSREYGLDAATVPAEYRRLIGDFERRLSLVPEDRPLALFLDALDQLSPEDSAQNLAWLPEKLPPGVRVVVSTLPRPETALEVLLARCQENPGNILPLKPMPHREARSMLRGLLADARRTLQREQEASVMRGFQRCRLPLYLKLAFEEARLWKSHQRPRALPAAILPLIGTLFARLSNPANHGRLLVARSLGYLTAGKNGLTESELLDVLTRDTVIMGWVARSAHHVVPEGQPLPVVIWSRLYFDLRSYLSERSADRTAVLSFFHRQFREAVKAAYLTPREALARHRSLAEYMASQATTSGSGERVTWNARKLSELPYQQRKACMWDDLERTLCDLGFIEAKCSAGLTYDLVADYNAALADPAMPAESRGRIEEFGLFVRAHSHILSTHPGLTFQLALNEPDSTSVARTAQARVESHAETRPHFRWVNKPQSLNRCVQTLAGHRDIVNTCDVSPDGKWIISGSSDRQLKVWNAADGKEVRSLPHEASVETCAFSPDGTRILSGTREGHIALWDAAHFQLLFGGQHHQDAIANSAFSRDGRLLATTSWDKHVAIREAKDGRLVRSLECESAVCSCDFSADGMHILCGTTEGRLRIWDLRTWEEVEAPAGHRGSIYRCVFSRDGRWILSCSQDGTLKRWDAGTQELLATYTGHRGPVWSFALSVDESRCISGSFDQTLMVWDVNTAERLATLREHAGQIWGVACFRNMDAAVSASWDWTVKVWSFKAVDRGRPGRAEAAESGPEPPAAGPVICCDASGDGRYYAAGSADGHVRLWDARTAALLADAPAHRDYVLVTALSPDGQWLVSGDYNGVVQMRSTAAPNRASELAGHEHQRMLAARFSADGRRLLTCSTGKLRFWEITPFGANAAAAFEPDDPPFRTCALSRDGAWAIVGNENGALVLCELPSWRGIGDLGQHEELRCCALSPDDTMAATVASDGTLKLWDVANRREIASIRAHETRIESCNFSPDGARLVTAAWDAVVKLWNASALTAPTVLAGHTDQLQDACFTAGGAKVLSACMDGTLRIWDARTGAELGMLIAPAESARSCVLAPGARSLVSISQRSAAKVWAIPDGAVERVLRGHSADIRDCAFSPDGALLATASTDATVRLWDSRTWKPVCTCEGHRGPVLSCAFSPHGRRLASASCDGTVKLWDTATGRETAMLAGHSGWVKFVLWCGEELVSCGADRTIRIWDAQTGAARTVLNGCADEIQAVAISLDGSYVLLGTAAGELRAWHIASGSELFSARAHAAAVRCCGFSRDGRLAFSGSMDRTLKVWDIPEGRLRHELSGHGDWVLSAALSPGGGILLSGSRDQCLKMWDTATGSQVCEYWVGAPVESLAVDPGAPRVALGDGTGQVHLLELASPLPW